MKPDSKPLQQQLANLKERLPNLSSRLSQAAVELREAGVPIDERLMEQLIGYRQDFDRLRSQTQELAKSSSVTGVVAPAQIASLLDIQGVLHSIASSEGKTSDIDKALQILDRFLALTHREQSDFSPLREAQAKARELRRIIVNSPTNNLPNDVPALVKGTHPCCALLALIDPEAEVNDEQWGILVEVAARGFGKPLTVAASRGKLKESVESTPVAESSSNPEPEMIVISGSGSSSSTEAESQIDRLLLDRPTEPSNLPDVIILPSFDESQASQRTVAQPIILGETASSSASASSVGVKVLAHIERIGDREFRQNEFAGTRGKALRLEGFAINIDPPIPGLSMRYMAHIQGTGDTPWASEGESIGTRGAGLRIEGFAIELTGSEAANYNVYYMAHIERVGDTQEFSKGEFCGRRGMGLRIEGIKVRIEPKSQF